MHCVHKSTTLKIITKIKTLNYIIYNYIKKYLKYFELLKMIGGR